MTAPPAGLVGEENAATQRHVVMMNEARIGAAMEGSALSEVAVQKPPN